ncbi:MAG: Fe-S-cluster-containing hydrogenase component 2 [Clostridia bacterium]|jgi:carbon-monoxide dehydrogenase iron sulfur subunit|nr:Fe-S-cluster-containing hydrogenase component 2 [Clostridia bacterium]
MQVNKRGGKIMKRVYVNEDWCLGCHLCEYHCSFANSGKSDMVKAFNGNTKTTPRIVIEEGDDINFAVQCRHCDEPLCVKGCIAGALTVTDGVITIDDTRCVGCYTCVLSCPFGCIVTDNEKVIKKCDLCISRTGEPACVKGCPNAAIVFEERG